MRTFVALATAATAGLLGLSAAPTYAARPITHARDAAQSQLVLTISAGEKARPAQRRARLTCAPAGGTLKQAKAACALLKAAKGNPAAIKNDGSMCMMIYDPVTVTATGNWRSKPVRYTHTYGN